MTDDAILVLQCLFQTIWQFFTSWYIPGTKVTPASFALFLLVAGLGLNFLFRLLGVAPSVDMVDTAKSLKSGHDRGVAAEKAREEASRNRWKI